MSDKPVRKTPEEIATAVEAGHQRAQARIARRQQAKEAAKLIIDAGLRIKYLDPITIAYKSLDGTSLTGEPRTMMYWTIRSRRDSFSRQEAHLALAKKIQSGDYLFTAGDLNEIDDPDTFVRNVVYILARVAEVSPNQFPHFFRRAATAFLSAVAYAKTYEQHLAAVDANWLEVTKSLDVAEEILDLQFLPHYLLEGLPE